MTVELTRKHVVAINEAAWEFWRFHANGAEDWTRAYLARRGLRGLQAGHAPEGWAGSWGACAAAATVQASA